MGYDKLLYKDLHFNIAQFCSIIHRLVIESQRLLVEDLLLYNSKQDH